MVQGKGLVVFDFDGTFFDNSHAHVSFLNDINERYHLGLTLPSGNELFSRIFPTLDATLNNLEVVNPDVRKELSSRYEVDFRNLRKKDPNSELIPDIVKALTDLRADNFYLGYFRDASHQKRLAKFGIENLGLFDFPYELKRDDRDYQAKVEKALKNMKTQLASSKSLNENAKYLYVGDSTDDSRIALYNGFRFVGVGYNPNDLPQNLDAPIAKSPQDLVRIIREIN